ncbi:DegV family protein [Demequina sp. NBRC 110054]|uniref:DegV family protein n=1 Tax=Demequina sp. NBRC 110054 TaxID=1570343 RepID=UPI0013566198|nr:DegV family protein [Demequina sp. NBRC 110054]
MTTRVAVVTDSAASLPDALAATPGLTVVPLTVVVDGTVHSEGVGLAPQDVSEALDRGEHVSTAHPGPDAYSRAIDAAVVAGADAVLVVTLSRQLSGAFDAARVAAGRASVPVDVVDSGTVTMAQGLAALAAREAASGGASLADCAAEARRVAEGSRCLFTVDSLEPLRRGGRLSGAAAALGSALAIRPLLTVRDGEIVVDSRERTTRRARAAVASRAAGLLSRDDAPAPGHVRVASVVGLQDDAVSGVRDQILGLVPEAVVVPGPVSSVLAAHAGAGAVAACVAEVPEALAARLRSL